MEEEQAQVRRLVSEINEKASGVFIWVKLMIDELIEAIVDGANFLLYVTY